jgi:hypothetical protein
MEFAANKDDPHKESKTIALSTDPRTLGEFIGNLLGQRRRLSRHFDLVFFIDWPWLHNLDQLIVQRVTHQNDSALVDFSFKLYLDNGRVTHVSSRTDFQTFRDLSNVETVGVELAWTFLVTYPASKVPEKQEIRITARTEMLDGREKERRKIFSFFEIVRPRDDEIALDIYYSNITWGEDLMQLISSHALAAFRPKNQLLFGAITL